MGLWDEVKEEASKAEDVLWDIATAKPIRDAALASKPGQAAQQLAADAKQAALDAANKAKAALSWAPYVIVGGLVIAGLFVAAPYVLPFITARRTG